jgi:hypothetical protein
MLKKAANYRKKQPLQQGESLLAGLPFPPTLAWLTGNLHRHRR